MRWAKKLTDVADALRTRVADLNRGIICLEVDLESPANRAVDPEHLQLRALESEVGQHTIDAMRKIDRQRSDSVRGRLEMGSRGFAAVLDDEPVGYVFFEPGSDSAARIVHPDLEWLPFRPRGDEVYTYDYFLAPEARGNGHLFCRAVQQAQFELGFRKSFGYVYRDNRAALWLYRTVGWQEIGRRVEHRFLTRFSVVDRQVYFHRPFCRDHLFQLPGA